MPEEQLMPTLPPDALTPWLARNRKLVILLGFVLVLGGTLAIITWQSRPQATNSAAANLTNSQTNAIDSPQARPTFQRSTVTNTPTTLPPAYRPPTTDDLRRAITNLNTSTTPKQ